MGFFFFRGELALHMKDIVILFEREGGLLLQWVHGGCVNGCALD